VIRRLPTRRANARVGPVPAVEAHPVGILRSASTLEWRAGDPSRRRSGPAVGRGAARGRYRRSRMRGTGERTHVVESAPGRRIATVHGTFCRAHQSGPNGASYRAHRDHRVRLRTGRRRHAAGASTSSTTRGHDGAPPVRGPDTRRRRPRRRLRREQLAGRRPDQHGRGLPDREGSAHTGETLERTQACPAEVRPDGHRPAGRRAVGLRGEAIRRASPRTARHLPPAPAGLRLHLPG